MKNTKNLFLILFILLSSHSYASIKCIAHRGDNKYFFENSYESLYSAIDKGAHGVEFDIVHTKDQVPIVLHDLNLRRLATHKKGKWCELDKAISKLTYQEIKSNCILKNLEEIPTLKDFLIILRAFDVLRFIELKDAPTQQTFDLIKEYNYDHPELLRVISFKKSNLKKFYKKKKENNFWSQVRLLALYKSTLRPSKKYGVNIHHSALPYINIFKRKGRELGIWTADSPKLMLKAQAKKIAFITTNDPQLCLDTID